MALSGTISGAYRGYTLQTLWTATQNIAGNYSDITATHRLVCASTYSLYISSRTNTCTIDGTTKNFTSPAINTAGGQTIALGTTTQRVYHNADGTKSFAMKTIFNMQAEIAGVWVSSITASGTITLDRIPRQAVITNANNFNDEQNPSMSYSNAGGFSMTAYLQYGSNRITKSIGSATSGNVIFELTEAQRNALRNATPNSPTLSVIYGLETTISGTVYTSTATRTMTIVNANPTAVSLSYSDTNSTTVAITGDNQRIIQNKSILTAVIGSSTAKKGATITSYSTTINGVIRTGNGTVEMGVVNLSQNGTLTTTVTDSRGFKSTTSVTVIIDAWQDPTAIVTLSRINNFETTCNLKVDGSYSSLNGQNTLTCEYCTKRSDASTYSNWTTIANRTVVNVSLDNLYGWTVKVRLKDRLSGYIEYFATIGKGIPIMFIDTDKRSVGFNCFPTKIGSVEANGIELDNNIYIGSQMLIASYDLQTTSLTSILGAANYDLIDGMFAGITIPTGYTKGYRITAQVTTTTSNSITVYLNNKSTNSKGTYSGNTYRCIVASEIFKQSDITLEPVYNYTNLNGVNLKVKATDTALANIYAITVHGFIVKE